MLEVMAIGSSYRSKRLIGDLVGYIHIIKWVTLIHTIFLNIAT